MTAISDLTAITTLDGDEELVVAQPDSTTRKITVANVRADLLAYVLGEEQLDYAQITTPVTVSATAVASATTCITGAAVSYDGSTRICIEVFSCYIQPGTTAGAYVMMLIFDGSTSIGIIGLHGRGAAGGQTYRAHLSRNYFVPSAGSHTYSVRCYRSLADGVFGAGAGGADTYLPAFMRITRAGS